MAFRGEHEIAAVRGRILRGKPSDEGENGPFRDGGSTGSGPFLHLYVLTKKKKSHQSPTASGRPTGDQHTSNGDHPLSSCKSRLFGASVQETVNTTMPRIRTIRIPSKALSCQPRSEHLSWQLRADKLTTCSEVLDISLPCNTDQGTRARAGSQNGEESWIAATNPTNRHEVLSVRLPSMLREDALSSPVARNGTAVFHLLKNDSRRYKKEFLKQGNAR